MTVSNTNKTDTPDTSTELLGASTTASPAVGRKARLLLVDDHPIVRQGLALMLSGEPDLDVVGQAEDVPGALRLTAEVSPDLVVADLSMSGLSGLDLLKEIKLKHGNLPVLMLSMHDETVQAERALRAGARGYVMKQEATGTIITAIRQVLAGHIYLSDRMSSKLLGKLAGNASLGSSSPIERLSDREFQVFTLIGQGIGPRAIAEKLGLSVKTVEAHRENIKAKLGLGSGNELIRYAMQYQMDQTAVPT
ncbi:response regulator transcription factor [Humisphaera borealis]|uniref:Response regulator transcription factor n=1 Tax=Humisphaera borealis TaxID=2807512 RepID=A0A7M2WTI3_9BACT|nr:response regulator transcription factor [Humisphaera borealis]QOV88753.1 response regulator transcription factor [Humisphaera borealis]